MYLGRYENKKYEDMISKINILSEQMERETEREYYGKEQGKGTGTGTVVGEGLWHEGAVHRSAWTSCLSGSVP